MDHRDTNIVLKLLVPCTILTYVQARVGYEVEATKQEEEICKNEIENKEYRCAVGHCCADESCCTYYYELWWFWLIWTLIILMSCCCAYHHRKKRQNLRARRTRNGASNEPFAGTCNYPGPPADKGILGYIKLPKYEEVIRIPPSGSPPPPYRSRRALNSLACLKPDSEGVASLNYLSYNDLTSSMLSLVSSRGFCFVQRDSAEKNNKKHYTRTRQQNNNFRNNEAESLHVTTADDTLSQTNIPAYSIEDQTPVVESYEKQPIHIINCLTSDLTKQELDSELPLIQDDLHSVESESSLHEMEYMRGKEEIDICVNQESSFSVVDEVAIEKYSKQERQRQDSGIDTEDSSDPVTAADDCMESNNCTEKNERHYRKMLPLKHTNLVKHHEKSKNFLLPTHDDEDSSSSDDEDDDQINYILDLNNNGSSSSHYSAAGSYSDSYYLDGYDQAEHSRLKIERMDGHNDFVLELSPVLSHTQDQSVLCDD